ncbi:MAG: aspartate-alanine antiporter [Muribaculaceae bacterium]|nr:aspartate-alanine antiporter [Muribaculaceae bacterium]MDE7441794.1 aspartate-alanine antiporter [Muribaculaceae bacterium]
MSEIITFFRQHPLIPIFLTLGLGFWLGKVKIKGFALGSVAATLIVGVIIGQMKIAVPDILKNVFFLFFLFSVGYGVGPQFFRSMRGPGLKMAAFSVVGAMVCAGIVIAASYLMGYDTAIATGLFAGSQTVSACLGMVSDTVKELPMDDNARASMLALIPACYAVTYIFGTVGSAWFLSTIAPKMMGGIDKVKEDVARIEQLMDKGNEITDPGIIPARRPVIFRAFKAESDFFDTPRSASEIHDYYQKAGVRLLVERARINGKVMNPSKYNLISKGDEVVLGGRAEVLVALKDAPGKEVYDPELLNFGAEKTPVTISSKGKADGITLEKLRSFPEMERVIVSSIKRTGMTIPVLAQTELHAGDILTLVGWPQDVAVAASVIGYADPASDSTDMVFVGLGIALGCIIGALSIKINGIPMSLGMSVGALISGLSLGWLRTRRPIFGHIPSSVLWIFNNLGVNMFIAILGLVAGGALIQGLKTAGPLILLVGALLTIIGLIINIFIARKLFRFSTPVTLGCVAGARLSVASIGAIQNVLQSDVPNLGYTVTYAVANIALVFSSLLVLFLT